MIFLNRHKLKLVGIRKPVLSYFCDDQIFGIASGNKFIKIDCKLLGHYTSQDVIGPLIDIDIFGDYYDFNTSIFIGHDIRQWLSNEFRYDRHNELS